MAEQDSFQKRQVAYKVSIEGILKGDFEKDDMSAHLKIGAVKISRVNVMGTVVLKSQEGYSNAIIDDGTGRVSARSFDGRNVFIGIDVGDIVLVIGKIREFNNERYIMAEIIKKIDGIGWLNVRKLELSSPVHAEIPPNLEEDVAEDMQELQGQNEKIYSMIKKLDSGDGAMIEDVIKNFGEDAEKIIQKLIENGDIFEIRPGKIKVLE